MAYVVFGMVLSPELHSFLCLVFIATRFFLLYTVIAWEFITTACNNFLVIVITRYCNVFVVVATIFSVVIDLFFLLCYVSKSC